MIYKLRKLLESFITHDCECKQCEDARYGLAYLAEIEMDFARLQRDYNEEIGRNNHGDEWKHESTKFNPDEWKRGK